MLNTSTKEYLTYEEAASFLGITASTIRSLVTLGVFHSVKPGEIGLRRSHRKYINIQQLEAYDRGEISNSVKYRKVNSASLPLMPGLNGVITPDDIRQVSGVNSGDIDPNLRYTLDRMAGVSQDMREVYIHYRNSLTPSQRSELDKRMKEGIDIVEKSGNLSDATLEEVSHTMVQGDPQLADEAADMWKRARDRELKLRGAATVDSRVSDVHTTATPKEE